ncbi:MAG: hypothetical protein Q8O16_07205 [Dehalococcoidia bacterium]|nr:hypothetical protein [Dehalococcoidia bacterium]
MNLYAFTPTLASNIQSYSRKYQLGLTVLTSPANPLAGLIILGDGTPDDLVVTIISHHLNGSNTVGIVKPPGKTGTSTFDLIRSYITYNNTLKTIVLIIDGEENNKKCIYDELEKSLKKQKIEVEITESQNEDRFRLYDCIFDRRFKLALVINGRDDLLCQKHTVEDHLLLMASELKLMNLPEEVIDDPKKLWLSLSEESKEKVFRELSAHRKLIEDNFPQQIQGLNYLKP